MLYHSTYLYFQSHVIFFYTIFFYKYSCQRSPFSLSPFFLSLTHSENSLLYKNSTILYRVISYWKPVQNGTHQNGTTFFHSPTFIRFTLHPYQISRNALIHHTYTHRHTLPSNYIWTLQKPPKAEIIEFIIPFYFQVMRLIYTRSNPLPSYANIYRVTRQTCTRRRRFSSFSLSSLFFPFFFFSLHRSFACYN